MSDKDLTTLSDQDKAVLFLYLCAKGLPPWGYGADQWRVLAALTGWDEARTMQALKSCVEAGLAGKEPSE